MRRCRLLCQECHDRMEELPSLSRTSISPSKKKNSACLRRRRLNRRLDRCVCAAAAAAASVWSQSIFSHMQVQCRHLQKGSFSTLKIRRGTYKETSAGGREAGSLASVVFFPQRSVCSLLTSNRTRLEPDCVTASVRPRVLRRQRLIVSKGAFHTCLCLSVLLGQILLTTRKSWLFLVA